MHLASASVSSMVPSNALLPAGTNPELCCQLQSPPVLYPIATSPSKVDTCPPQDGLLMLESVVTQDTSQGMFVTFPGNEAFVTSRTWVFEKGRTLNWEQSVTKYDS